MGHAITLHLPNQLYEHYLEQAQAARRAVEAELLKVVTAAAQDVVALPEDLEDAVAALPGLDDEELWKIAKERFAPERSCELENLHFKQQDQGLNDEEKVRVQDLLHQSESTMLLRAEAAKLLDDRGHDVSSLFGGS